MEFLVKLILTYRFLRFLRMELSTGADTLGTDTPLHTTPNKNIFAFKGNENISKKGAEYTYTPEQIKKKKKCIKSPAYFAETYFKIVSLDYGLQNIQLYDFQREIVESYDENRKMLLATSRQVGKTTIVSILALHYVIFNERKSCFVLGNKEATAIELLDRIKLAFEYLPLWLKVGVIEMSKTKIVFENGSSITAAATSSDSIRGRSANMLLIDECIDGNQHIKIKHKKTGEIKIISLKNFYELLKMKG